MIEQLILSLLSFFAIFTIIPTILFEFIIYSLFIRKDYLKLLGYAILINAFTWSLAALMFGFFLNLFWLIEFFVFVIEIPLIKLLVKTNWLKALLISFVANLITTFLGIFFGFI